MAVFTQKPSTNISSYIQGFSDKVSSGTSQVLGQTSNTISGYTRQFTNAPSSESGIGRVIAYVIGIILIVVVISLLIHHFVTPIYAFQPGAPGIITIPGFDTGVLFWNGSGQYPGVGPIKNEDLPIVNTYYNYSLIMDMFIQNPMQFSRHPRILFSRGATPASAPTGNLILSILSNYNLVVALEPDTTDLIISVLNTHNQSENAIIPNAPVQEPFRLGIIVMEHALEVYINGNLMKTRTFTMGLKDVKGDISPASGVELNIAKIQNLKLWNTVLTSPEMRAAKPDMASAASFGASPIPSSTSCAASPVPNHTPAFSVTNAATSAAKNASNALASASAGALNRFSSF
jgi:hypothetical protein